MTHVTDDLELYALGALPEDRASEVARHLSACPACRTAAAELADLVGLLPDAIPLRQPPAQLKTRILAAAGARPARGAWRFPFTVPGARALAVAAALVVLLGVDVAQTRQMQAIQSDRAAIQADRAAIQTDRDEYEAMAENFAHGGRTWYMAGIAPDWKGMGGNLVQPASGDPAFVLFHDLRGLPDGQVYALWLISPDGKWIRGTSFRPDGRELQPVTLGQDLAGYERCAVTIESGAAAKREGPIVMQSRIAPPTQ